MTLAPFETGSKTESSTDDRDILIALQVRFPEARSVLFAGVGFTGCRQLVGRLTSSALGAGICARVVGPDSSPGVPGQVASVEPSARLADLAYVREFVAANANTCYLFAACDDFLSDSQGLVWAASMQGVVLVTRQGRTTRRALRLAEQRIVEAGGRLLGTVLSPRP